MLPEQKTGLYCDEHTRVSVLSVMDVFDPGACISHILKWKSGMKLISHILNWMYRIESMNLYLEWNQWDARTKDWIVLCWEHTRVSVLSEMDIFDPGACISHI
jgi:hypothetical protein